MSNKLKRRSFLKASSLLSIPVFTGGLPISAFAKSSLSAIVNGESDKILVLIQLDGGNDGLATLIPLDQQDNLAAVRPNIFIPENQVIKINDDIGFHPEMSGMNSLLDDAKLNIVQGVSYPNQNRSHFRSTDIWNTGSAADEYLDRGWLGRYLDSKVIDFPTGYPNAECPDPFALTIGQSASETCQGTSGNFSMVILDPEDISALPSPTNNELASGCYDDQLKFLAQSIEQSNAYGEVIKAAYNTGQNVSNKYSENSELASKLKTTARLISGGLQTKIFVVSLGGFDTHADQIIAGDTKTGRHAELLKELSDAICAFQDDLKGLGLEERVLGMTYSEFGRRIRSNDSLGTDHGTAAPLFVFGKCVIPGIVGENAQIESDVSDSEGVPMQYDFRSIYGSILIDWFEASEEEVSDLFANDFQYLPIVEPCAVSGTHETIEENSFGLVAMPNPHSNNFNIRFSNPGGFVRLSLFDVLGAEIKVILDKPLEAGDHELNVETHELSPGPYFLRIQNKSLQKTLRLMKI